MFRVLRAKFRVLRAKFRVLRAKFRVLRAKFRVLRAKFRVLRAKYGKTRGQAQVFVSMVLPGSGFIGLNPTWRIMGLSKYGYGYLNWGYKSL